MNSEDHDNPWPPGWRGRVVRRLRKIMPATLLRRCFSLFYLAAQGHYEAHFRVLSIAWSLRNMARLGFDPAGIVDVGAYTGQWTRLASTIFPAAHILMIEPQPDKHAHLTAMAAASGGRIVFDNRVIGPAAREAVPFFVMQQGSSVLTENTDQPRAMTTIPMTTLDDVCRLHAMTGPMLLKLDIQGYEIEALKGAVEMLETVEVLLLEISTLDYIAGAPAVADVVNYLAGRGFVLYDLCDIRRRGTDNAMLQLDACFARADGPLRQRSNDFHGDQGASFA